MYSLFTAEKNLQTGKYNNYHHIDSIVDGFNFIVNSSVDVDQVGDLIINMQSVVNSIIGMDADSILNDLGQAVKATDSIVSHSISGSIPDGPKINPFSGSVILRANIPRIFVGANAITSKIAGQDGKWSGRAGVHTSFFWAFKIPEQYTVYGPNGNILENYNQNCCNESYFTWDVQGTTFYLRPTILNHYTNGINNLANTNSAYGPPAYSYSNYPSSLNNGYLNITDDHIEEGETYSVDKCGCQSLLIPGQEPGSIAGILIPRVVASSSQYCGDPIDLQVLNLPDLYNLAPNATVELRGGSGNLIANMSPSNNPVFVNGPGTYTISFKTEGCSSTNTVVIDTCSTPTNEHVECLDGNLSLYPVPLGTNDEMLNVEMCTSVCTDSVALKGLLPLSIKIKSFSSGNTLTSSNNLFSYSNLINSSNGCIVESIDLRNISGYPVPTGTILVVEFQLRSGQIIRKLISIN